MNPNRSRFRVLAAQFVFMFGFMFGFAACSRTPEPPQVTTDGIGAVRLGMTGDDLVKLGGAVTAEAGECQYVRVPGLPPGVLVMVADGVVRRIDVTEAGVATEAGVGVHHQEAGVRSAYPAAVEQPHKYDQSGRYFIVQVGGDRRLIFETDGTAVTRYRVGVAPQVDWVEGCG